MKDSLTEIVLLIIMLAPHCLIASLALFIALIPRAYTRRLRHRLAEFVVWQWVKGSKLSSIIHDWLWKNGNGNGHKKDMVDHIE